MHIAQRIRLNIVTYIVSRPSPAGQQTSVPPFDAYFQSNESEFSHYPVSGCCRYRRRTTSESKVVHSIAVHSAFVRSMAVGSDSGRKTRFKFPAREWPERHPPTSS